MKRSAIQPGKPLRRTKGVNPVSARRRASFSARAEVREQVAIRDRGVCRLSLLSSSHHCAGGPETHELRKASADSGTYTLANCVLTCSAANAWVEDFPDQAHALGLVVRNGETVDDALDRQRKAGWRG